MADTLSDLIGRLDDKGRCCGRKPMVYKRPKHRLFCDRCCRQYDPQGTQTENWAWKRWAGGFVPTYPNQDYPRARASDGGR